ncbi:MAG: hypothetical protein HQ582_17710 [Planctomycetes bacterium]|nr:hypothetical protein [Planctomycetota bacterium]
MSEVKGDRLYVSLSASQVRRRLEGHGFGVRKVHSDGKNRAVVIHTATGDHLRQLEALFRDVLEKPGGGPPRPDAEGHCGT